MVSLTKDEEAFYNDYKESMMKASGISSMDTFVQSIPGGEDKLRGMFKELTASFVAKVEVRVQAAKEEGAAEAREAAAEEQEKKKREEEAQTAVLEEEAEEEPEEAEEEEEEAAAGKGKKPGEKKTAAKRAPKVKKIAKGKKGTQEYQMSEGGASEEEEGGWKKEMAEMRGQGKMLEAMVKAMAQNTEALKTAMGKMQHGGSKEEHYDGGNARSGRRYEETPRLTERKGFVKVPEWHGQPDKLPEWRSRMSNFLNQDHLTVPTSRATITRRFPR